MPRTDRSLHQFVRAEANSTGQLKRACETCGGWIMDKSRSKFCKDHRRKPSNQRCSGKRLKTYSANLSEQQNAALSRFEQLTGMPVFGLDEFERGDIDASTLWERNKGWLESVWADVQNIQF